MRNLTEASLWRHGDFMKLWTGQTVSEFGSVVTRTVLPITAVIVLHNGARGSTDGDKGSGQLLSWLDAPASALKDEGMRPATTHAGGGDAMPQGAWSAKRERQYKHIKAEETERGRPEKTAERIAAATVNRTRTAKGETKAKKSATARKRAQSAASAASRKAGSRSGGTKKKTTARKRS